MSDSELVSCLEAARTALEEAILQECAGNNNPSEIATFAARVNEINQLLAKKK